MTPTGKTNQHFWDNTDDVRREELIRKIEAAVGRLTTKELEALLYDMFSKGYVEEY